MADARDTFVTWLQNAHAVEQQALTMLNGQASRLESYPELRARIEQHIRETESQAVALEEILDRYDTGSSTLKDMGGSMAAMGQAAGGMFMSDEVLKGATASYAFEHMEIATYRSLIAAAESVGDTRALSSLTSILQQEVAMADWLSDHLPDLTRQYLARDASGMEAKR